MSPYVSLQGVLHWADYSMPHSVFNGGSERSGSEIQPQGKIGVYHHLKKPDMRSIDSGAQPQPRASSMRDVSRIRDLSKPQNRKTRSPAIRGLGCTSSLMWPPGATRKLAGSPMYMCVRNPQHVPWFYCPLGMINLESGDSTSRITAQAHQTRVHGGELTYMYVGKNMFLYVLIYVWLRSPAPNLVGHVCSRHAITCPKLAGWTPNRVCARGRPSTG